MFFNVFKIAILGLTYSEEQSKSLISHSMTNKDSNTLSVEVIWHPQFKQVLHKEYPLDVYSKNCIYYVLQGLLE